MLDHVLVLDWFVCLSKFMSWAKLTNNSSRRMVSFLRYVDHGIEKFVIEHVTDPSSVRLNMGRRDVLSAKPRDCRRAANFHGRGRRCREEGLGRSCSILTDIIRGICPSAVDHCVCPRFKFVH